VKDYPIGLKQPQSKKSYFKSIVQAKKWDPDSHIAIQRAKMAELYEEHLRSREFTVENIGVVRSSTNTNWNVPYLKPDKVIDVGIRNILVDRLKEYGGDAKKAFVNLDENPIWLNKKMFLLLQPISKMDMFN